MALTISLAEPEHTDAEERIEPPPKNSPSTDPKIGNVKKIVEDAVRIKI